MAAWPSCRGPRQPAANELGGGPVRHVLSPSSNAWPARPRHTRPRHIPRPNSLRALHRVPSNVVLCAYLPGPHSVEASGSAFPIKTGSEFPIGISQDTIYFWADGRKSTPLTISMIDIDCHRSGNPESAKAFADWLRDNYFPCLYHEPSTNGKGRHGYFVLFKEGFGDVAVANILKRLEKTLKKLLQVQGYRIKIGGLGRMANLAFGEKLNLCGTCSYLCTMFMVYLVVANKYNVYVR